LRTRDADHPCYIITHPLRTSTHPGSVPVRALPTTDRADLPSSISAARLVEINLGVTFAVWSFCSGCDRAVGQWISANAVQDFLPLEAENWITCGNALRLDWLSICPPTGTGVKLHGDDFVQHAAGSGTDRLRKLKAGKPTSAVTHRIRAASAPDGHPSSQSPSAKRPAISATWPVPSLRRRPTSRGLCMASRAARNTAAAKAKIFGTDLPDVKLSLDSLAVMEAARALGSTPRKRPGRYRLAC
jgi:hypothetical protein